MLFVDRRDAGRRLAQKVEHLRGSDVVVEVLRRLGVGCVTLANKDALDFGVDALLDTLDHLDAAGVSCVGAGIDERSARAPAVVVRAGTSVGIVGVTDHPRAYAARA